MSVDLWNRLSQPDIKYDEVLFPLTGHRLSFISSPESDYDVTNPQSTNRIAPDNNMAARSRDLMSGHRASSDPSISAGDNIAPPNPFPGMSSAVSGVDVTDYSRHDPRYVSTSRFLASSLLQENPTNCGSWLPKHQTKFPAESTDSLDAFVNTVCATR